MAHVVPETWQCSLGLYVNPPLLIHVYTVSPLHVNEFHYESTFISPICKSKKVSLGTISCIVLYCNRFIILFIQIIHKKQTKVRKTFLILQYLALKSTVVQYNS